MADANPTHVVNASSQWDPTPEDLQLTDLDTEILTPVLDSDSPTPDQNVTEDLLHSVGLPSPDGKPIHTADHLQHRDYQRWELDPESSEDYADHQP